MNVPVILSLDATKTDALTSWKQIAAYLGAGVRTAQRYEQEFEMPVRRFDDRPHASVWAYPNELDTWLRSKIKEHKPSSGDPNLRLDIALSSFKGSMTRIGESLLEHARLRKEASRLRAEMNTSMAVLCTGLRTLSSSKT